MAKKYLEIQETKRLYIADLEGSLDELADYFVDLKNQYGGAAYLGIDQFGDEIDVEISWTRSETDIERDKRLAKARKVREVRKAERAKFENRERAELARLQEKYS